MNVLHRIFEEFRYVITEKTIRSNESNSKVCEDTIYGKLRFGMIKFMIAEKFELGDGSLIFPVCIFLNIACTSLKILRMPKMKNDLKNSRENIAAIKLSGF